MTEQSINGDCYNVEEDEYGFYEQKRAFPEYFKICGRKFLRKSNITGKYEVKRISSNYIGSVEDGNFVEDMRACKSGYALYFYGNGEIIAPEGEPTGNMFLMCVTINEVESHNNDCYINYTITNSYSYYNPYTLIYNVRRITGSSNSLPDNCQFIMTKIKLFKDYLNRMEELKDDCLEASYLSEPFTCGIDELRKLWYYYNHIENYLMYKNDEDVINYLIQANYPLYGINSKLTYKDLNNRLFLNLNYYIFLLLVFIF